MRLTIESDQSDLDVLSVPVDLWL